MSEFNFHVLKRLRELLRDLDTLHSSDGRLGSCDSQSYLMRCQNIKFNFPRKEIITKFLTIQINKILSQQALHCRNEILCFLGLKMFIYIKVDRNFNNHKLKFFRFRPSGPLQWKEYCFQTGRGFYLGKGR